MRIYCVIRVLIASLFASSIGLAGAHGGTMSSTQTSFKRKPWLARRCSCRVWVVKPSGREGSQSNGIANERRERAKGRQRAQREYKGNERGEEEKEREKKKEIVIFLCVQFFTFYSLRMTAFYLPVRSATRANGDVYERGEQAAIKPLISEHYNAVDGEMRK